MTNSRTTDDRVRVGVRELRGSLAEVLRQARHGTSFVVMSRDQPVAEIRPPPAADRPRRPIGLLRGRIRMSPDFDATPAEVIAAMEGEDG